MVPQLQSGPRGRIKIGSRTLAFVTNIQISEQYSVVAPHCFGKYHASSTEPLSYGVSGSIGAVYPVNDAAGNALPAGAGSDAISAGLVPLLQLMATAEDVTIEYQDRPAPNAPGVNLKVIHGCRPTGDTLSMSAQQLAQQSWSFTGIYNSAQGQAPAQMGY